MKPSHLLQKGKIGKVINEDSPICGEVVEIDFIDRNQNYYLVKLAWGHRVSVPIQDVTPWLGHKLERDLYKAQLHQLQLLALELNDRDWFEQIGEVINKLKQ